MFLPAGFNEVRDGILSMINTFKTRQRGARNVRHFV